MQSFGSSVLTGAALVVAGALAGNELAVALVHAQLARLDEHSEVRAARLLAILFGRVMPGWYALTLVLTLAVAWAARARGDVAWVPSAAAAALYAASIAATIVALVPINNRIAGSDVERVPTTWRDDRRRWDARHRVRVGVLLLAFALLAASAAASGG